MADNVTALANLVSKLENDYMTMQAELAQAVPNRGYMVGGQVIVNGQLYNAIIGIDDIFTDGDLVTTFLTSDGYMVVVGR